MSAFSDDIPAVAGFYFAYGNDDRFHRGEFTADHSLQVIDDSSLYDDGIDAVVRCCTMAAFTGDINSEHVGSAHAGTGITGNMAGIDIEPDVNGKAAVYAFQCSVFDHGRSTGGYFFSRLESQFDRTTEVLFHIVQNMSCSQHHGNMAVMTAGMHDTGIFTGKRKACFFCYCQGIHIAAEEDGFARFAAFNRSEYARFQSAGNPGYADFIEFFFDYFTGIEFFFAEFWIFMKIPSHVDLVISVFFCNFFDIHYKRPLFF